MQGTEIVRLRIELGGSESCPMAGSLISGVEPRCFIQTELVSYFSWN